MFRLLTIVMLGALLLACAPSRKTPEPMPVLVPPPSQPQVAQDNPGSLFDAGQSELLFEDNRARRVGDIVLVNIVDTSKGTHKADTDASKESALNFGVEANFGKGSASMFPFGTGPGGATGTNPLVKASSTSGWKSEGETTRESDIKATVAARVVHVMPNGLLQVEGAREMRINEENQILVLRGLVRARDIRSDNSIPSTYLADAKIEFYGQGVLADKQRAGWLTRILDNAWPF